MICNKCQEERENNMFVWRRKVCKLCYNEHQKEYREKNKDVLREKRKLKNKQYTYTYIEKNRDKWNKYRKEYQRKYREKNKEK